MSRGEKAVNSLFATLSSNKTTELQQERGRIWEADYHGSFHGRGELDSAKVFSEVARHEER